MKQLIAILLFITVPAISYAQGHDSTGKRNYTHYQATNGVVAFPNQLIIPQDTTPKATYWNPNASIAVKNGVFYYNNGTAFVTPAAGASGVPLSQLNDTLPYYLSKWLANLLYQPVGSYLTAAVTSITANAPLTGGIITGVGSIGLGTTGTAGTYGDASHYTAITTDIYGRVSSVSVYSVSSGAIYTAGTGISISGGNVVSNTGMLYGDTAQLVAPYLPSWLAATLYQPIGNYALTNDTGANGKFEGFYHAAHTYQPIGSYLITAVTSLNGAVGALIYSTLASYGITNAFTKIETALQILDSLQNINAGTGISVDAVTHKITNTAPDQTVVLNNGYGILFTGTYPNFTGTVDTTKLISFPHFNNFWGALGSNAFTSTTYYPNSNPNGYTSNLGTVTSVGATFPILGGTITGTGTLSMQQATTLTDGYISHADWNTFNNKQATISVSRGITESGTTIAVDTNVVITNVVLQSANVSYSTYTVGKNTLGVDTLKQVLNTQPAYTVFGNNTSSPAMPTFYVINPPDTTISAAYTLTALDQGRTIHCANSSNIVLTIATGLGSRFKCSVYQEGSGTVTPTASGTIFVFYPVGATKTNGGAIFIGMTATTDKLLIQGALQ